MPVPVEFDRVVHIGVPLAVHHLAGADFTGAPGTVNEDLDVRSVCPGDVFVLDDAHVRHRRWWRRRHEMEYCEDPAEERAVMPKRWRRPPAGFVDRGDIGRDPLAPGFRGAAARAPTPTRPLDRYVIASVSRLEESQITKSLLSVHGASYRFVVEWGHGRGARTLEYRQHEAGFDLARVGRFREGRGSVRLRASSGTRRPWSCIRD